MKKKKLMIIGGAALALCVLAICIFVVTAGGGGRKLNAQLELGARYLEEMEYEQAIAAYTTALEIDPKSVDAYLGLAEAYVGLGDYDSAAEILRQGYEHTGDARLEAYLEELTSGRTQGDGALPGILGADPAQGGEGVWDGYGQENVHWFVRLCEEGDAGGLLSWEEVTLFGHGISDLNYQTARELFLANGFSRPADLYETHDDGLQFLIVELGENGSDASIMQYDNKDVLALINYNHRSTNNGNDGFVTSIREIGMRDSLAEVLSKLGFTNPNAIAEHVREMMAEEYHSDEEIMDALYGSGVSGYRDAAHDSYIGIGASVGGDDGGVYRFMDFSMEYRYDFEGGGSVEFTFDEGLCLKRISISNRAGY